MSAKGTKADIDSAALTYRNFMSTRPSKRLLSAYSFGATPILTAINDWEANHARCIDLFGFSSEYGCRDSRSTSNTTGDHATRSGAQGTGLLGRQDGVRRRQVRGRQC